jgi:hypothetical protein
MGLAQSPDREQRAAQADMQAIGLRTRQGGTHDPAQLHQRFATQAGLGQRLGSLELSQGALCRRARWHEHRRRFTFRGHVASGLRGGILAVQPVK